MTTAPEMVNWDLAAATARRLALGGPKTDLRKARAESRELRRAADESVEHVHRITGLEAAQDLRDSDVLVVDRQTWARANLQSMSMLLAPGLARIREDDPEQYARTATGLNSALTGVQAGGLMSLLGTRVLGQYDPFVALPDPATGRPFGPAGGRLMLVAPNVMQVRTELNVRAEDFRLWVCLHEQTHRVQFAAAPWLRHWLQDQITEMFVSLFANSQTLSEQVVDMLTGKGRKDGAASVESATGTTGSLLDVITTDDDRERLSRITAVMSLLEGHANVVMDAVDRSVIPTVKTIRRRFTERGANGSALTKLIRRLTGMDAKARQYQDGQKFVNRAIELLGTDGFNQVWTAPELLPSEAELHDAAAWADRIRRDS